MGRCLCAECVGEEDVDRGCYADAVGRRRRNALACRHPSGAAAAALVAVAAVAMVLPGCWSTPNVAYSSLSDSDSDAGKTSGNDGTVGAEAGVTTEPTGDMTADGDATDAITSGITGDLPPPSGDCPDDEVCEVLPDGWSPVSRPSADSPDLCPMGSHVVALLETEPGYQCQCDCEAPDGGCVLNWQLNEPDCADPQVEMNGCGQTSGTNVPGPYLAELIPPSCDVATSTLRGRPSVPQLICEPDQMAPGCGEGRWCTAPSGGCLIREGRNQCPPGFPRREIVASSWGAPNCGFYCDPCTYECAEEVVLWTAAGCMGEGAETVFPSAVCTEPADETTYYSISYDPEPTCFAEGLVSAAAVTEDFEFTLCCRAG